MQQTEHKSFEAPEETREFPNGRAEILQIGGGEVGRLDLRARLALVERRASRSPRPTAARRRTSSTTSAAASRSAWTTAPSSSPVPATSRRCRAATTPGSSATSRSSSSTGSAPATTPRPDEVRQPVRLRAALQEAAGSRAQHGLERRRHIGCPALDPGATRPRPRAP